MAVPAGLIGARIYFDITTPFDITPRHAWWGPLAFWNGGLGEWGGIAGGGVGVQGSRFHLHAVRARVPGAADRGLCLPVRGVSGPGPARDHLAGQGGQGCRHRGEQAAGCGGPARRRQVVGAGALVAQRVDDEHEIRWPGQCPELPAEVMLMTRLAPLACSCSATRTAKGAPTALPTTPISPVSSCGCVLSPDGRRLPTCRCGSRPTPVTAAVAGPGEVPGDVTVGVEQAHARHGDLGQVPLPVRLAQQFLGPEHRVLRVGLPGWQRPPTLVRGTRAGGVAARSRRCHVRAGKVLCLRAEAAAGAAVVVRDARAAGPPHEERAAGTAPVMRWPRR